MRYYESKKDNITLGVGSPRLRMGHSVGKYQINKYSLKPGRKEEMAEEEFDIPSSEAAIVTILLSRSATTGE